MCGICGVVDFGDGPDADAVVRRMTPTMRHRGPDDEGYLESSEGRLALGMRRLSIIDVEGGHQPVFNEDGTVGAVLNGEIYNFRELRSALGALGHVFKTRSDSEVVAHAYAEWGPDCVKRLHGMFAFAVYDGRRSKQKDAGASATPAGLPSREPRGGLGHHEDSLLEEGILFLARDRVGIKPLYYASLTSKQSTLGKFIFASEVRTLLASGIVPKRLSQAALESFLLFGSLSEPMTLVEGVLSLPPGHTLSIDLNTREADGPKAYWNIGKNTGDRVAENSQRQNFGLDVAAATTVKSLNGHGKQSTSKATVLAHVRTLLEESVRSHLIADVPVGVFLSGGIDSTSLAALASREVSGIHTFTVAFAEKEFNEAAIARRTAAKFGTTHQEVFVSPADMLARVGDAVGALDQPSIDGINTYFVSSSARNAGLKVTLSGLGGDEVFGGYSSFRRTPRYQQLASAGMQVPDAVRAAINTTASVAMKAARSATKSGTGASGGRRFVQGDATRKISAIFNTADALPDPFYFARTLFTPVQISDLMSGKKVLDQSSLWWQWLAASAAQARGLDSFAAVSCMELQSYLVNTLLRDTDSMSMAHSLEVRVPLLDHSLLEFVTSLPQEMKVRKGVPKALLVAALGDLLPSEVVNQTKRGFTFPWAEWLRGPLKERIESGLSELSPALAEVMNAQQVRTVWLDYLAGETSWSRPWSLYVLNEWIKAHLD